MSGWAEGLAAERGGRSSGRALPVDSIQAMSAATLDSSRRIRSIAVSVVFSPVGRPAADRSARARCGVPREPSMLRKRDGTQRFRESGATQGAGGEPVPSSPSRLACSLEWARQAWGGQSIGTSKPAAVLVFVEYTVSSFRDVVLNLGHVIH